MEKHDSKDNKDDGPSTYRERSLFLPIVGLLTVVFTGAFVAAFVLTWSDVKTLSTNDANLRQQIGLLRMTIKSMKAGLKDVSETVGNRETDSEIVYDTLQESNKQSHKKRQIQGVSFIAEVLKAQEQIFERYCQDHNTTCPQGAAGDKGPQGDNGTDGVVIGNVTNGVVGPPGDKGMKGESGKQGIKGPLGEKGDSGDKGSKGTPGEKGLQGPNGDAGSNGTVGDPGDKGLQGDPGSKGETGEIGIRGIDGDLGLLGDPGAKGSVGPKGPVGDTGKPGVKGNPSRLWTDSSCQCLSKSAPFPG